MYRNAVCFPSVARKLEPLKVQAVMLCSSHCVGCMACQWDEVPLVEPKRNTGHARYSGSVRVPYASRGRKYDQRATVGAPHGVPGH